MTRPSYRSITVWYFLIGLGFLIYAQIVSWDKLHDRNAPILLLWSLLFLLPAIWSNRHILKEHQSFEALFLQFKLPAWRIAALIAGLGWMLLTFYLAAGNVFTWELVFAWCMGILWWMIVLLLPDEQPSIPEVQISLNTHTLLVAIFLLIGAASLFFRLDLAPYEMLPDHQLKLADIILIERGDTRIYFMNSFGREPFHFYWTYLLSCPFGINYTTMKLATAITMWLTLPALYALGRQINGKQMGLFTLMLGSTSLWIMINGRSGFRAAHMPLFVTLHLLFLWRAFQHGRRIDFLLAGLFLGGGMHTYSAMRIIPLIAIFGLLMQIATLPKAARRSLISNFGAMVLMSSMVYMPLFSFWMHHPDDYWLRSSGLTSEFNLHDILDGIVQSALMFNQSRDPFFSNGVHDWGVTGPILAALSALGIILYLAHTIHARNWMGLLLPVAFLGAILPSGLGGGTATDIPNARRAIGAFPIVTVLGAYPLFFLYQIIRGLKRPAYSIRLGVIAVISAGVIAVVAVNWHGYFDLFTPRSRITIGPAHDVAEIIKPFLQSGSQYDDVYIVFWDEYIWVDAQITQAWVDPQLPYVNTLVEPGGEACTALSDYTPKLFIYGIADSLSHDWISACFDTHLTFTARDGSRSLFYYTIASWRQR